MGQTMTEQGFIGYLDMAMLEHCDMFSVDQIMAHQKKRQPIDLAPSSFVCFANSTSCSGGACIIS